MINIIKYFFTFFIFFSIFTILLLLFSDIFLKKFKLEKNKIKIYVIFMDLTNIQILCITLSTLKYVFILYSLINIHNNYLSLIFILILTLLYNFHALRPINILFDILLNIILYFIIISKDIFINYIINVDMVWYAIVLFIITILFGFIFSFYIYIKEILFIIKKNKFIKRKDDNNISNNELIKKQKANKLVKKYKKELGDENKK